MPLFDLNLLDRLEGLNARYTLLTKRLEELTDKAATYDREPDRTELQKYEALRQKVRAEALALAEELLKALR